jgi:hypothetical protein
MTDLAIGLDEVALEPGVLERGILVRDLGRLVRRKGLAGRGTAGGRGGGARDFVGVAAGEHQYRGRDSNLRGPEDREG